ncbi:iron ABC transporter, partial [Mesorhizobium sp. M4A.F.Ca.ET.029.04.2.1]
VILSLCLALAVSVLLSLTSGASDASAVGVVRDWLTGAVPGDAVLSARDRLIVYDIRLPRALLGVLIGAALAVSGAVMQGLFRNPLADPGLIGVSAGSSLGAVAVIVLGSTWLAPLTSALGTLALPLAAFTG